MNASTQTSSTQTSSTAYNLRQNVVGARSTAWWGMVMLITTEAMIFASLFSAYLYVRANSPAWPQGSIEVPELVIPLIGTALLLGGSVSIHLAQHAVRGDAPVQARTWMAVTFILALIFLSLQAFEYSRSPFTPTDNAYASLFFTITGIHGLHVIVGAVMVAILLMQSFVGYLSHARSGAVMNAALYWHFVDVIWLFVLAIIYLSPRL
ncbi:heme-copper oxidase subunit III [Phototrophicus methaneseepsis]|uniref:cytochrome-c oxidase n=1 Tax=Phototrophicus methaneseepsis TaxID=2710758 RepID=A0A7S8E7E4_9CHLR|nr:cytochrome c oxidase subunit 3 [Phototrophicus methaneseepsis]QPC81741.1 heme-copper oxidase subunit III [Phototrophicus methaneseepsis]